MNIKERISSDLGVTIDAIDEAVKTARIKVLRFDIKKRNGDTRPIFHPSKKTKMIQYWLIHNVFNKLPIHPSATAYINKKSILDNATSHKSNNYFLKIDFKDFFPSIKFNDLHKTIISHKFKNDDQWILDKNLHEIIRLVSFYHKDSLAVGYPSSPIISNVIMYNIDKSISEIVSNKDKFGDVIYTRYADDLVFSTNKKGACTSILKEIKDLLFEIESPSLNINFNKLKFNSSTGGSASVTGLRITRTGNITIFKKQKDHIRLLLSLLKKNKLNDPDEKKSLLGHLSYIKHVDSAFYTKILQKYFKEVHQLNDEIKNN